MATSTTWAFAWMGAAGLCLSGCIWSQTRPAPVAAEPESEPSATVLTGDGEADPLEPAALDETVGEPTLEVAEDLLIRIHNVQGVTAAQAGALLEPATEQVEECEPAEPGTLNVRLVAEEERTIMEVEPGSNVDADTRRCVLAALAVVDDSEGLGEIATPADRPRQYSSNLSISW